MNAKNTQVHFDLTSAQLSALVKALKTGIFSDLSKNVFISCDKQTQLFKATFLLEEHAEMEKFCFLLGLEIGKNISQLYFPPK